MLALQSSPYSHVRDKRCLKRPYNVDTFKHLHFAFRYRITRQVSSSNGIGRNDGMILNYFSNEQGWLHLMVLSKTYAQLSF